jgi:hypothetical protein
MNDDIILTPFKPDTRTMLQHPAIKQVGSSGHQVKIILKK